MSGLEVTAAMEIRGFVTRGNVQRRYLSRSAFCDLVLPHGEIVGDCIEKIVKARIAADFIKGFAAFGDRDVAEVLPIDA